MAQPDTLPAPSAGKIRLGEWCVEPRLYRVSKEDHVVALEPKVMAVLELLIERHGEMVPREELWHAGWGDDYAGEEGLRRAIMLLRRMFGDDAKAPRYIETIPRAGYRLIASVSILDSAPSPALRPASPFVAQRAVWGAVAILLAFGLTVAAWQPRDDGLKEIANADLEPLTTYPGRETDPSLSPDGRFVAYVWSQGGERANLSNDVFVRHLDQETPRQITAHEDREALPVWSPDGQRLAFARYGADATKLLIQPVGDGAEHLVSRLPAQEIFGLAWSPDGNWLAYAQRPAPGETVTLWRVEIESGFVQRLTAPPAGIFGDLDPAWSADGLSLAFVRRGALEVSDLFLLDLESGASKRLTDMGQLLRRPAWSPDGDALLFVRRRGSRLSLAWVARDGGEVHDLELGSEHIVRVATAPGVRELVVERRRFDTDLWRLDLGGSEATEPGPPQPARWLSSSSVDLLPAFSADNRRVAFVSERSGSSELWVAASGDDFAERLTAVDAELIGRPQWSPDGEWIAFDSSRNGGEVDLYLIPANGGDEVRLTDHPSVDCLPAWSRDGKFLNFASNRTGRFEIWRQPQKGGTAVRLTWSGGLAASESHDGRWLFYSKPHGAKGLWRRPLTGGEESLVVADFDPTVDWALTPKGVFYVERQATELGAVVYRDLPSGEERTVWELDRPARELGMAASGDGRYLALSLFDAGESDLLLSKW